MATYSQAARVREELAPELFRDESIHAVGLTETADGYAVKVDGSDPARSAALPTTIRGVPIIFEQHGAPTAQAPAAGDAPRRRRRRWGRRRAH